MCKKGNIYSVNNINTENTVNTVNTANNEKQHTNIFNFTSGSFIAGRVYSTNRF